MVTSVAAKVSRLEEATGGGGWDDPPCDGCGWGDGEDPDPDEPYEIALDEPPYDELSEDDIYSKCGRVLCMIIFFD
jgi:hypothetical protein